MISLFIKIFKGILIFLGSIIGLLLLYVLFNLNIFHRTRPLSKSEIQTYLSQVDSSSPLQYVAEKFDTHSVVFLGEFHKRKQDLDFFKQIIPYLYLTKDIKIIGWEFGAADYQKMADSVVPASVFVRAKAIAIMRNSMYDWCFEDYLDVFKTIWQLNKTILQDSNKIKFLQLNKPFAPKRWNSLNDTVRLNERKTSFDNILPIIVEKEVIQKNKKILIYCGWNHSLTRLQTPKFFFLKEKEGRAGELLFNKYSTKICQLWLVAPFPPRWWWYKELTNNNNIKYVYPFEGVFNQLYDTLKKPFFLDAKNAAFADLKDYNSFYAFDTWGGIKLKNFCDGAVMLAPFDKVDPINIISDWVTTQQQLEDVKKVLPDQDAKQIQTIQDLMNYINPTASQKHTKEIHSLGKFW